MIMQAHSQITSSMYKQLPKQQVNYIGDSLIEESSLTNSLGADYPFPRRESDFGSGSRAEETLWRCMFPGCKSQITFTRQCDLRKHLQQHRRTLLCRYSGCPKSRQSEGVNPATRRGWFATVKDRNRHEAKHNPKIPCEGFNFDGTPCDRVFSRRDNMMTHMRKIHGPISPQDEDGHCSNSRDNDFPWIDGLEACMDESTNCMPFDGPILSEHVIDSFSCNDIFDSLELGEQITGDCAHVENAPGCKLVPLESNVASKPGTLALQGMSAYIEWLKRKTTLPHDKLTAALTKIEESAIVIDQFPHFTKDDLLGIGLPLGIVVSLQQNYDQFLKE